MYKSISADELKGLVGRVNIIDIRDSYLFNNGNIPTSKNVPVNFLLFNPDNYMKKDSIYYMYDDKFAKTENFEYQKINDEAEINSIVKEYFDKYYNEEDDKETWFNKMKDLAEAFGYAREVKEFKANPEAYKGHVGDISTVIRVKVTGR